MRYKKDDPIKEGEDYYNGLYDDDYNYEDILIINNNNNNQEKPKKIDDN